MKIARIRGARVATGPRSSVSTDIRIANGRIRQTPGEGGELDLSGHLILPGLINAHDHLEFNLFPRLSNRIYANAGEWAADIYRPEDTPVKEHRAIPKPIRLMWGAIKNLVAGVTTVAHHNPYDDAVFENLFPVRVVKRFGWAHSLEFSDDIQERFARTPDDEPFILHAAEGADATARLEIRRLAELGLLCERTVLVHANAAGPEDLDLLRARRCSIVWCPTSNLANYRRTLTFETLRAGIPVTLGTDSGITAEADLLDEIRVARERGLLTVEDVYRMVTCQAAAILRLRDGEGEIRAGGVADLIAVADEGQTPAEAIFDLRPKMVMVGGEVKLVSRNLGYTGFHSIRIERRGDYFIDADIPRLSHAVTAATGPEIRLSGKLVGA